MTLTDKSPFPIGRFFRDVPMEKVPASHLLWWWDEMYLYDEARIKDEKYLAVHNYIKENFSALETECPDRIISHRPQ